MFKKIVLSLASAAAILGANAASGNQASPFYLVVPLKRAAAPEVINVTLEGAFLSKARVGQAYLESLRPYLTVTGSASYDPSVTRWSLADGALPAGLELDGVTGDVIGTPISKTTAPSEFTVVATYKTDQGSAIYVIEVGGVLLTARQIAVGNNHACAITEASGVKCWGYNAYGQLGDNSNTLRKLPVDVVGLTGVKSISAGMGHTCAVLESEAAKCWGRNDFGQLGDNSVINRWKPVSVSGLSSGVASISAGQNHSCALTNAGAAKCWGSNGYGQLGDNSTTKRLVPVAVAGLSSGVAIISTGYSHTCALTTTGGVKCWGENRFSQIGDNSTIQRNAPVDVFGLDSGVASIDVGQSHTCAVTTTGAVKCWGRNDYGQLGIESVAQSSVPVDTPGLSGGISKLAGGSTHTCALTTSGGVKCWGYNAQGQLGDNSTTQRLSPVDVVGLGSGVSSITAGDGNTCALLTSGTAKCWGYNGQGQLGDGTLVNRMVPVGVEQD